MPGRSKYSRHVLTDPKSRRQSLEESDVGYLREQRSRQFYGNIEEMAGNERARPTWPSGVLGRLAAFKREVKYARRKIIATPEQMGIATDKATQFERGTETVLRVVNLAEALNNLAKQAPFNGKEASWHSGKHTMAKEFHERGRRNTPIEETTHFYGNVVHRLTRSEGSAKYNAVVFLSPVTFVPHEWAVGQKRRPGEWGFVKGTIPDSILGIQVMDPDIRVLVEATKSMLKRRSKKPIFILDWHGDQFFP